VAGNPDAWLSFIRFEWHAKPTRPGRHLAGVQEVSQQLEEFLGDSDRTVIRLAEWDEVFGFA
jgi:hypothetical protein